MGQANSRSDATDSQMSTSGNEALHPGSSLFDFTVQLLDGMPEIISFPASWDELMDWADEANVLTAVLQADYEEALVGGIHPHDSARINIRFVPNVHSEQRDKLKDIPNMSWIERANFFSKSVAIMVQDLGSKSVARIPAAQFCQYYALARQLSDLLAVQQMRELMSGIVDAPQPLRECLICQSNSENALLPCGHCLCGSCEERWVRRQLSCPFCRKQFKSVDDVQSNAWELTEWSQETVESDVATIESKLKQFWTDEVQLENCERQLETSSFEPVERVVRKMAERDSFLLVS